MAMATYSNTTGYALSYDIVILGDAGVGKSAFLMRHIHGNFQALYIGRDGSSPPVELMFRTNYGLVRLRVSEKFASGAAGPDGFDGAVYMFDLTNRQSYRALKRWLPTSVPAVLCGNKADIKHRKIRFFDSIPSPFFAYFETSANCRYNEKPYNFEKPFLALMRKLSGFDDLEII